MKDGIFVIRDYEAHVVDKGGPELGAMVWILRFAEKFIPAGFGLDIGGSAWGKTQQSCIAGATIVDPDIGTGNAYDLSKYYGICEFVVCSHVLEHLEDPEAAFAEIAKALKPGGLLFIYSPYPGNSSWDPRMNVNAREQHKWQPTPTMFMRMMMVHGILPTYAEHVGDDHTSFVVMGTRK